MREFITLVRDDSGSNIPGQFLEKALYIINVRPEELSHSRLYREIRAS